MHEMKLFNKPFELIQNGTKTIELRLYDKKRLELKIGDTIIFTNRKTGDQIKTKVINLHICKNFSELYSMFDKKLFGYAENETADPEDMEVYYSEEELEEYGVVGIEIELIN